MTFKIPGHPKVKFDFRSISKVKTAQKNLSYQEIGHLSDLHNKAIILMWEAGEIKEDQFIVTFYPDNLIHHDVELANFIAELLDIGIHPNKIIWQCLHHKAYTLTLKTEEDYNLIQLTTSFNRVHYYCGSEISKTLDAELEEFRRTHNGFGTVDAIAKELEKKIEETNWKNKRTST